ncbi:hypothetical protein [uncultured Eudoraea sp.]|jgi:chemotaxis protein MotB|uniref:hypothetical protein n=1 Tax=uncultured Eudoraea sp. TaxID=1035614 RepID=UPI0026172CF8|nr:hypothetical protein [uncultured Eudoraea sp.]
MNRITLLLLLLVLTGTTLQAQNKKELIAQVNSLNAELQSTKAELTESKKNEKISAARADSFESQLKGLEENNATLLQNLNNFTAQSNNKLDNLSSVMESLRKKEAELKFINDALTSNDSISLLVLTKLKQTLGENANIKVERGSVVVIMDQTALFGANSNNTELQAGATESLNKIAGIIKANPDMAVTLEFHTDDASSWEIIYKQAASVTPIIGNTPDVKAERIMVSRKTDLANSLYIMLHPDFNSFYLNLRQNMKK